MTARLLDGRALAHHLRPELRERVDRLAETVGHGEPPVLAIVSDGHHGAASLYAHSLERAATSVGVETTSIVDAEGHARAVLSDASRDADLLVIGARRRQRHFGLQLGRVTHGVLHHSACPVVIVPEPE